MKIKLFVIFLVALVATSVPVMAQTNTNDHWADFDGCNNSAANNTAVQYEPSIKNPQKVDETKGEKLVSYSSGSCAHEHTRFGLAWIWRNAEYQDLQRSTGLYDPRCNNRIEEVKEVVVPKGTTKTDKPLVGIVMLDAETLARLKAIVAKSQANEAQPPQKTSCSMDLNHLAEMNSHQGSKGFHQTTYKCGKDGEEYSATNAKKAEKKQNCGAFCRFWTTPAVPFGYGYAVAPSYGTVVSSSVYGGGGGYFVPQPSQQPVNTIFHGNSSRPQ